MRAKVVVLLSIACLAGGCSDAECLPEPKADPTPPQLRIVVQYQGPGGSRQRFEQDHGDPAATLEADPAGLVVVAYAATDSSGLRSLSPSMALHQTVGVGVERRQVQIEPTTTSCPVAELSYEREVTGTGSRPAIHVSAVAENWVGKTSAIEPVTIRFR